MLHRLIADPGIHLVMIEERETQDHSRRSDLLIFHNQWRLQERKNHPVERLLILILSHLVMYLAARPKRSRNARKLHQLDPLRTVVVDLVAMIFLPSLPPANCLNQQVLEGLLMPACKILIMVA